MTTKYEEYIKSSICQNLISKGFEKVLLNIINDDENYITEEMKKKFLDYVITYDSSIDIIEYCNAFFYKNNFSQKGKKVADLIYKTELGRVCKRDSFRRSINSAIMKSSFGLTPISEVSDEAILDKLLIDSNDKNSSNTNIFFDFIMDSGISNEKVQIFPMWTFEGYYDNDVFEGYEMDELPCILGLPGTKETSDDYNTIPRIAFALKIPPIINVYKPTCFDAGMMPVWEIGGKTKPHIECNSKYSGKGLNEYIHESIDFNNITSEIYSL